MTKTNQPSLRTARNEQEAIQKNKTLMLDYFRQSPRNDENKPAVIANCEERAGSNPEKQNIDVGLLQAKPSQ